MNLDDEPSNPRDALKFAVSITLLISVIVLIRTDKVWQAEGIISLLWNMSLIAVTIFALIMLYSFLRIMFIKRGIQPKERDAFLTLIPFIAISLLLGIASFYGSEPQKIIYMVGLIALMVVFSIIAGKFRLFGK